MTNVSAPSDWPAIVSCTPVPSTRNVGVAVVVSNCDGERAGEGDAGTSTTTEALKAPMTPPTTLPLEFVKLLNVSEPVAMLTATGPSAISALASVSVVSPVPRVKVKSPVIETPATRDRHAVAGDAQRGAGVQAQRRLEAAERERLLDLAPVVLTSSANVPQSVTPGTFCSATVPLRRPATPPVAPRSRISVPEPLVSVSRSCVPSPRPKATLASVELDRGAVGRGQRLDGEVAGDALAGDAERDAGRLEAQVRPGRQVADGGGGRVQREAEAAGELEGRAGVDGDRRAQVTGDAGGAEGDRRR